MNQAVNVLVVDDEEDLRELLVMDLEAKGYNTLEAEDGNQAMEVLEKNNVGLVVSDVVMPNMDGIELLEKIRERDSKKPPVILISAFARITVPEAYEKGAEAFFPKPFDRKALISCVEKLLAPPEERWQRSNQRYDNDLSFSIKISSPNLSSAVNTASILNIGRGGMFLAWGDDLPKVGEKIEFNIAFSTEQSANLHGTGVVRWVRSQKDDDSRLPGMGIEFINLSKQGTHEIFELLNLINTKSFIPRS